MRVAKISDTLVIFSDRANVPHTRFRVCLQPHETMAAQLRHQMGKVAFRYMQTFRKCRIACPAETAFVGENPYQTIKQNRTRGQLLITINAFGDNDEVFLQPSPPPPLGYRTNPAHLLRLFNSRVLQISYQRVEVQ